ncbi:MAG TPA: hypothetical protein VEY13_12540, partial [Rubrobacteraceae bacterium]|nr:hypothetical protein [Rubrobacteraceae bacterium]
PPPPQEASAMPARTNVITVRDRTARLLLTLRSFFEEGREPSPPRLVCLLDTPQPPPPPRPARSWIVPVPPSASVGGQTMQ